MKPLFPAAVFVTLSVSLTGQSFENGFSFDMPYTDTASVEYLPLFDRDPVTEADRVGTDSSGNFTVRGVPFRFYGGNLTTRGAFPRKEDAPLIAGRMKKYGFNLVRFHHIDNPWSDGSLFHGINGTRQFNPERLDRLDYLIYQLKQHGIYVNMNLHVSRTFEPVDGVVHADSLSDFGKGVTQFDPAMIALQKEYAGMLLGHTNPYTGMPLAEDPVLAMVEIINENSLFRMWYSGALKPVAEGGKLPLYYNDMLDSLWLDFLAEKYDSTAALEAAWSRGRFVGDTLVFDGFEDGFGEAWQLELHQTANAAMDVTGGAATGDSAARIHVTARSSETWHTKFKHVGATVQEDSIYELTFKAKADAPKQINVSFQRDNSPWTWYSGQNFLLDTVWQEFTAGFRAPEDNSGNLRIGFGFEHNLGRFWFDDVLLTTETNEGLLKGESLDSGNVARLEASGMISFTDARLMDQTEFYAEIQREFLEEMGGFLKDSLGVGAPLTGTNWFTGPEDVYVQNTLDYVDNHSYWDHPHFPSDPWSPTDWTIKNTPMLTAGSGTVENLFSGLAISGKPYTVSEYNHAFPNQYQSELLPVITSYLSFNDGDGFMIFTYSGSWDWDANRVSGFFDIHRNSSLMGSFPLYSYAFRHRLTPASEEVVRVEYSREDILRMPRHMENWWSAHVPYARDLAYDHRIEMSTGHETDFDPASLPPVSTGPYSLNAGSTEWEKNGLFKIATPRFVSITGHPGQYAGEEAGALTLRQGSGFGTVTWLSLTDSILETTPRSVIAIGTSMMNTGMLWDGTTTVHNNWGSEPALVRPLDPELRLKTAYSHMRIVPLDVTGQPAGESADTIASDSSGYVTVILDQTGDRTLWYGIDAFDYQAPADTTTGLTPAGRNTEVRCFPNPAGNRVEFSLEGNSGSSCEIAIINASGLVVCRKEMGRSLEIDTEGMPPGLYFYRLRHPHRLFTGKFLIAR